MSSLSLLPMFHKNTIAFPQLSIYIQQLMRAIHLQKESLAFRPNHKDIYETALAQPEMLTSKIGKQSVELEGIFPFLASKWEGL